MGLPGSENGFISHGRRLYVGSPSNTTRTSMSPRRLGRFGDSVPSSPLVKIEEFTKTHAPYLANLQQCSLPCIRGHTSPAPQSNNILSDCGSRCGEVVAQWWVCGCHRLHLHSLETQIWFQNPRWSHPNAHCSASWCIVGGELWQWHCTFSWQSRNMSSLRYQTDGRHFCSPNL